MFVDIEPDTGNIDISKIEEKITEKTRAIIPVQLYGVLCDMKKIRKIANRHNLKIVSDCAHSLESERDGYNSAAHCDAACYSFYATKNLSCGEGGAVVCKDESIAEKIKILRLHGLSKTAIDRYQGKYQHYDVLDIGWKYNLDDIHSAMLINQLDRLNTILNQRNDLYKKFAAALSDIEDIKIPKIPIECKSAHHLFTVLVKNQKKRDEAIKKFQENGVPVAVNFNPIHLMKVYRDMFGYKHGDFPNAEKFGASTITLPFYTKLSEEDFEQIIKVLRMIFK